ncbi:MAG: flagellar motor switch protein FliG [Acidobacteriaceae bacterium]|nr:flagellar motor switch protein FliG [Acidobacteriaceae bacterium]
MAMAKSSVSGARKAAILLTMLGDESAAIVLRNLHDDELQCVADEVARLGQVPAELSLQIFEEYQGMTQGEGFQMQGGQDMARRMMIKAFGEQDAVARLQRLVKAREEHPLEALQRADPQKLARFLESEHPQAVALILGQLSDRQASALLMNLPKELRSEAVQRLAALQRFSPEMAERVSMVLSRRLKAVGEQGKRAYSGFQSVADIMNCVDGSVAQEILERIESEEPSLAISIRDLMFTFADLIEVDEAQIRELMALVDKRVLATALKGTSDDLKNHFFRTMSSRAVEMLKEDVESLGPIRSKEVVKAQAEIVALARKLEAEGKIVLKGEGSDEYVV